MIRCAIIDDEPMARQLLEAFIRKTPSLQLVGAYASALQAREVLARKSADVIFLDIQMPDITGIEFLKTFDHRPAVILTTAYAEYALEGFELDVVDYLLKPFDFNRFIKAVNKLQQRLQPAPLAATSDESRPTLDFLFVKDGHKLVRIDLDDIVYIKGSREYITIYTRDRKVMSLQSMKSLEQELPPGFVRIHNSYIVRLRALEAVHKTQVEVQGEVIPIGITYKKAFFDALQQHRPQDQL